MVKINRIAMSYNPLVPVLVAAAAGVVLDFYLEPPLILQIILFPLFVGVWFVARRKSMMYSTLCLLGLVAVFFGIRHAIHYRVYQADDIGLMNIERQIPVHIEGWVMQMPERVQYPPSYFKPNIEAETPTRFILQTHRIKNRKKWQTVSGKIHVSVTGDVSHLQVGDFVSTKGKFDMFYMSSNPGQYDSYFFSRSRCILCKLNIENPTGVELLKKNDRYPFFRLMASIRLKLAKAVDQTMEEPYSEFAKAMVLGIREGLDDEREGILRETGTAHILAISGMHMGIVGFFLMTLFRIMLLPLRWNMLITIFLMLFYLFLTDMGAPAIRATVFIVIFCMSRYIYRTASNINIFAFAGIVLLLINPSELFMFGTHLSFTATGVLLWWFNKGSIPEETDEEQEEKRKKKKKQIIHEEVWIPKKRNSIIRKLNRVMFIIVTWLSRIFLHAFELNVFLWFSLLPLILYNINIASPVSMFLSPLLWFPFTLALILTYMLLICYGLHWTTLMFLLGRGADFFYLLLIDWLIGCFHRIDWGYFYLPAPPFWWVAGFYLVVYCWILFPVLQVRKKTVVMFTAGWLFIGLFFNGLQSCFDIYYERMTITTFAAGHGGATYITWPDGRNMLYDCGSFSNGDRIGKIVAKNILNSGHFKLDTLVFSHPDSDHYNGFEQLCERISISKIIVPPGMFEKDEYNVRQLKKLIDKKGIPVYSVVAGKTFADLGMPEIQVLHPDLDNANGQNGSNAQSLVLLLEHLQRRILFTGDADADPVRFLTTPPQKIDVMYAPHHGGASKNSRGIYKWGTPDHVVVCDGHLMRKSDSYQDLRDTGYDVISTFSEGAIFIKISQQDNDPRGTLSIRTWRNSNRQNQ